MTGADPGAAKLDGVNLLPYLIGKQTGSPHPALFWRFGQQRAVRMGDWKLTDPGNGAQLFDLAADLGERNDLAATAPEKLKELEAAYANWNTENIAPKWRPNNPNAAAKKAQRAANKKAAAKKK